MEARQYLIIGVTHSRPLKEIQSAISQTEEIAKDRLRGREHQDIVVIFGCQVLVVAILYFFGAGPVAWPA